jgi:hypothetical protein
MMQANSIGVEQMLGFLKKKYFRPQPQFIFLAIEYKILTLRKIGNELKECL